MSQHVGNKVKYLVEKHYKGTKKEFAEESGIGNATYLSRLFNSETISMKILNKVAEVLNISITDILKEDQVIADQQAQYGNKDNEMKMMKERLKSLEELNQSLKEQIALYKKMLDGK